jgi:peptide/nickel transport system permease protein
MPRLVTLRLLQMLVTLVLLSAVIWLLIGLMPGDPADLAIAADPRLGPEDAARLRALHGLDRPLSERYLAWASAMLQGQFGYSRLFSQPVTALLWPALGSSLVLLGLSLGLSAGIGVGLGVLAAARPRCAPAVDALAILAQSTPSFWLGMLLIILFAVTLGWLPAGGAEGWTSLVLPVATLTVVNLAAYARHAASAMTEVLALPYVTTARAKGLSAATVLWRHAFPNAALPLLTVAALDAGSLVSGALVTETIFARPGMGKLIYDAIMGNDYNLALLALLLAAAVTMLATLAADLAQRWLDPRLSP